MVQQAAGSASQAVIASDHSLFAGTWSADDRTLLYVDALPTDISDIRAASVPQATAARIVVPPDVESPALSPDGRWLAYIINSFPRSDIAVQRFPDGPRRQITADGGTDVVWGRTGREIFFVNQGAVYAVPVDAGDRLVTGKPVRLFAGSFRVGFKVPEYDVTRDGQRFLMVKPSDDELAPAHAIVVLNWGSEVRSRFAGSGTR
jgi:Tol biopolymer transport system component